MESNTNMVINQQYQQVDQYLQKKIIKDKDYNMSEPRLDGPYYPIDGQDKQQFDRSYHEISKPQNQKIHDNMEVARPISELMHKTQMEARANKEYNTLNQFNYYDTNTDVPDTSIVDASFVKTPFLEQNPVAGQEQNPFGLMIACDGYSMDEGLVDFWNMVVKQNVIVITSFNEGFKRDYGSWADVYRYFPDENEIQMQVGNKFQITNKVNQLTKTGSTINRVLHVSDIKTGKLVHIVTHVHFHAWEDFSVPAGGTMVDLMDTLHVQANLLYSQVQMLQQGKTQNPSKILMHCLAGRGRTGTALSILSAMMSLKWQIDNLKEDNIGEKITAQNVLDHLNLSVFSIVRRLRMQRATAVQAKSQQTYIYNFVYDG